MRGHAAVELLVAMSLLSVALLPMAGVGGALRTCLAGDAPAPSVRAIGPVTSGAQAGLADWIPVHPESFAFRFVSGTVTEIARGLRDAGLGLWDVISNPSQMWNTLGKPTRWWSAISNFVASRASNLTNLINVPIAYRLPAESQGANLAENLVEFFLAPLTRIGRERRGKDAMIDGMLRRAGTATDDDMREMADAMAELPDQVLRRLSGYGVTVLVGRNGVDDVDRFANDPHTAAYYKPVVKVAVMPMHRNRPGWKPEDTMAHEMGHVLDYQFGFRTSRGAYSSDDDFLAAFSADRTNIKFGHHRTPNEAFAESFSQWIHDPTGLQQSWPAIHAYWQTNPLGLDL